MKMAGIESHPKNAINKMDKINKMNLGLLSLKLKLLNFMLRSGNVEIISHGIRMQTVYKTHLFVSNSWMLKGLYKSSKGKEAINKPAAGVGTPSKWFLWLVSRLNRANLHAEAIGKRIAGSSQITEVSRPEGSAA